MKIGKHVDGRLRFVFAAVRNMAWIGAPSAGRGGPRSLSGYVRRPLEAACSAEYFVALRSQRYGVARLYRAKPRAPISSRLDSAKHSAPIGRRAYSDRLRGHGDVFAARQKVFVGSKSIQPHGGIHAENQTRLASARVGSPG